MTCPLVTAWQTFSLTSPIVLQALWPLDFHSQKIGLEIPIASKIFSQCLFKVSCMAAKEFFHTNLFSKGPARMNMVHWKPLCLRIQGQHLHQDHIPQLITEYDGATRMSRS